MITPDLNELYDATKAFWMRDYRKDVDRLNRDLAKPGAGGGAGFERAPPSVLTGDLFGLTPGDCLLVLGLNPKWQGARPSFRASDIEPAMIAWEEGNFAGYVARRAEYFLPNSKANYAPYFTRLGIALACGFAGVDPPYTNQAVVAQAFLRAKVAKLDLLPWWSSSVDRVRFPADLPLSPPLEEWFEVLRTAMNALRPQAIVVNGSGWAHLVKQVFKIELTRFSFEDPKGGPKHALASRMVDTLVLVHRQLGAIGGASHAGYAQMVSKARQNVGLAPPLTRSSATIK